MLVLSKPATYALELTARCNNRCVGCSNVYRDARNAEVMPAATWATLIDAFADAAVHIRLTGGEPTLHPEFFEILEVATSYDAWTTVFTNGRWSEPARFVTRLQNWPHLAGLLISVHGARASNHEAFNGVQGSFDETIANVRLAVERGITVAVSTVITHRNYDQVREVVGLARSLGASHVAFNRYLGPELPGIEPSREELRVAIEAIETLRKADAPVQYGVGIPQCFMRNGSEGCLAGVAYVSIDPSGRVRPCAHSPTVVGSLRDASLEEIWQGEAMNVWRGLMPAACTTCAAYTDCHGGCRAVQELRSNGRDPLRDDPLHVYQPPEEIYEVPANVRPVARVRLRREDFGYTVLGEHGFLPVAPEAKQVIDACDGTQTFGELAVRLSDKALNLLGEMWQLGMLDSAR
jgi:radical SAM protein with 4Fe4S-binding SPASM domain